MNENEARLISLSRDALSLLSFRRQADISAPSYRLIGLRAQDPPPRVIVQALGRRYLDEALVSDGSSSYPSAFASRYCGRINTPALDLAKLTKNADQHAYRRNIQNYNPRYAIRAITALVTVLGHTSQIPCIPSQSPHAVSI